MLGLAQLGLVVPFVHEARSLRASYRVGGTKRAGCASWGGP
jgi:hypothetical protein